MVLIIDELDISADQLFEDVIKNSVQMKSSLLSEKIQHLPIDGQKFIFVMDEWDCVFHKAFITREDQQKYTFVLLL